MIVVRNIFRLKFGKAKEATALWKQAKAALEKTGMPKSNMRLLTDLAGPDFYTIVFELTMSSLSEFEAVHLQLRDNKDWATIYPQIVALTEGGHREILSVIE